MPSDLDPSDLADQLPKRPLREREVAALANNLEWSVQKVSYATESGREYIPQWFAHRPVGDPFDTEDPIGDALGLHMDEEMTEWSGEIIREDVRLSTWTEVGDVWAAEMGGESSLNSVTVETEDGEKVTRELREPDDRGGDR